MDLSFTVHLALLLHVICVCAALPFQDRSSMTALQQACADMQGFLGLPNGNNVCFMNSVVQCLVSLPELVEYCLSPQGYSQMSGLLSRGLANLIRDMWTCQTRTVNPAE